MRRAMAALRTPGQVQVALKGLERHQVVPWST